MSNGRPPSYKVPSARALRARGYRYWRTRPVLEASHTHNLVYDVHGRRVWVTRMTPADYDDEYAYNRDKLIVEEERNGRWRKIPR